MNVLSIIYVRVIVSNLKAASGWRGVERERAMQLCQLHVKSGQIILRHFVWTRPS